MIRTDRGETPLLISTALVRGEEITRLLVDADKRAVVVPHKQTGRNSLHIAAAEGRLKLFELLIRTFDPDQDATTYQENLKKVQRTGGKLGMLSALLKKGFLGRGSVRASMAIPASPGTTKSPNARHLAPLKAGSILYYGGEVPKTL